MNTALTNTAITNTAVVPGSRDPKYYLVKRHLMESIRALEAGRAVGSERTLSLECGTSRTTVRQALRELVAEGLLVRRHGSGTYVAEPKMTWPLQLTSFTEQAAANGFVASTQLLAAERIRADDTVAARLMLDVGTPVYRIERLRLADDQPVAVETAHLPSARFPQLISRVRRGGSLYATLKRVYGTIPVTAEESISTAPASVSQARLLGTNTGTPMLVLGRQTFDATGTPVEWVTSCYRGDRVTFVTIMASPHPAT